MSRVHIEEVNPSRKTDNGIPALGREPPRHVRDEASLTSMPDLAAVIRHAARNGAKVVTGDHAQLAAVESGGMAMLARRLGYAQLTEAVRFRSAWAGSASLAIRAGEVSALGLYDGQGPPEWRQL